MLSFEKRLCIKQTMVELSIHVCVHHRLREGRMTTSLTLNLVDASRELRGQGGDPLNT